MFSFPVFFLVVVVILYEGGWSQVLRTPIHILTHIYVAIRLEVMLEVH